MAGVDEIVFHQLLAWHHFYDLSTPRIGLLADGFLHAAELIALVAGFFLLAADQQDGPLSKSVIWGSLLTGAGAFQLFDGIVDHKILGLHQIRYGVDVAPYDIAWNAAGLVLLGLGLLILHKAKRATADASGT